MTMRQKSARKAARTRAANKAAQEHWETVERPARQMNAALINEFLRRNYVTVYWAGRFGRRLKHGVTTATLLSVGDMGWSWTVQIKGYATRQNYHPNFWTLEPTNST